MATYEYRCPAGHVTEHVQPMTDDAPERVPCAHGAGGKLHLRGCGLLAARMFTVPAAIHFKGPGFYETDYRKRYDLKSRKRVADDLPLPAEAAITRAEGAEF